MEPKFRIKKVKVEEVAEYYNISSRSLSRWKKDQGKRVSSHKAFFEYFIFKHYNYVEKDIVNVSDDRLALYFEYGKTTIVRWQKDIKMLNRYNALVYYYSLDKRM